MIARISGVVHQAGGYMQQKLVDALTETQMRVAAIVAGALALLAAVVLAYRFCWRKERIQAKKEEKAVASSPKPEIKKQEETAKADSPRASEQANPMTKASEIPRITGISISPTDSASIQRLFEFVHAKDLLDKDDLENREAVEHFVRLVQDDYARRDDVLNQPRRMRIELYDPNVEHAKKEPEELAAKGCHFHLLLAPLNYDTNLVWYREMAISKEFLHSFTNAESSKDQAKLKELALKVVEEMKFCYAYSKDERKMIKA